METGCRPPRPYNVTWRRRAPCINDTSKQTGPKFREKIAVRPQLHTGLLNDFVSSEEFICVEWYDNGWIMDHKDVDESSGVL
jgi:hypothetical protein